MATIMVMRWDGVTEEQYDAVMERLRLDEDPPDGGMFHFAGAVEGGIRVVDIWESQEHFERFMNDRLGAVTQEVGLQGQPDVEFIPLHNVWAPRADEIVAQGKSAVPA
jgi:hypothetical protein